MTNPPIHGRITGPIVMIGFGSIGKGMLPLIERHFDFDRNRLVVIDPSDKDRHLLDARGIRFIHMGLTPANYREILTPLLTEGGGQGFCVNLRRHLLARHSRIVARSRRTLHRHGGGALARVLFR